ncbi:MAG: M20/M25/M40 family metallo-hydrolase [Pseudomonadota bacterium]
MIRELSMFTATEDLEEALSLVCVTALGLDRKAHTRMRLQECASRLSTSDGYLALSVLHHRLGSPGDPLPSRAALAQLFADEDLSMRALALHRGRNVYSAGKLALWNRIWVPLRAALAPDDGVVRIAKELVSFDTRPGGADIARCVEWLQDRLAVAGFDPSTFLPTDGSPIVVARRPARGLAGRVIVYGHYDAAPTDPAAWSSEPFEVHERGGRLYGLAVGDNKMALAVRLHEFAEDSPSPEILWILQGDEETGSRAAHRLLPGLLAGQSATLWLDENGYFDDDGTQRILARSSGEAGGVSLPPDSATWSLINRLGAMAGAYGVGHRVECRSLNKGFFATGCPFNRNLPDGARYLAIGVNDPSSKIHRVDESVPSWTIPLHARQIRTVFTWVDEIARRP